MNDTPHEAPAARRMMQMINGYWITQITHGAAQAGYADHLHHGPLTAEELARAAGLNPDAVGRHLRACAALGLVSFDGERFAATPLLDVLRRDHPQSLRGLAISQASPGHWLPWGRLTEALRSGEPQAEPALGSGIFDYMAQAPEELGAFRQAMKGMTASLAAEVARLLDTSGMTRIVDVGGAGGSLLPALLAANESLKGVLFDRSVTSADQAVTMMPADIAGRIEVVAGDFFKEVPGGDMLLLKHVLHDWDDSACAAILAICRRAMTPGARIAIVEFVLGEMGEPGMAPLMDMNMMVMVGGRERSCEDFTRLLEEAGFGDVRMARTSTQMAVIEATAA